MCANNVYQAQQTLVASPLELAFKVEYYHSVFCQLLHRKCTNIQIIYNNIISMMMKKLKGPSFLKVGTSDADLRGQARKHLKGAKSLENRFDC